MRIILNAWLALVGMAGVMALGSAVAQDSDVLDPEMAKIADSVRQLQRDISTINLLNGLNLTKIQQEKLLDIATRYRSARAKMVEDITADMMRQAEGAFMTLRAEIQKGMPANGAVPDMAAKIEKEIKELKEKGQIVATEQIETLDKELNALLTPGQLQVVADYKACLIPPANLKNPVRAGQASDSLDQVRALRTLRDVPEKNYAKTRDKIIDKYLDYVEKHQIRLTDKERDQLTRQMRTVAEKARKMTDAVFEMDKEKLAQDLQLDTFVSKVRKELEDRQPEDHMPRISKAGHFLLVPELASIMKERLSKDPETGKILVTAPGEPERETTVTKAVGSGAGRVSDAGSATGETTAQTAATVEAETAGEE